MRARIVIRSMQATDAHDVAALLPDLGYAASATEIASRFAALTAWPDQHVWLACSGDAVVGLVHTQGVRLLASDGYAEIQALVVAKARQGQGIGALLVHHAEAWARNAGFARVRLRSGIHREGAHRFYATQGDEAVKTSVAFERQP